ncbi:MAG: hypothetical protein IT368_07690, partial [Candidatus Hydrogenedentes bacterium]|nr:hypothetical protein [Candidatus Hydrogenedentota bacterium]
HLCQELAQVLGQGGAVFIYDTPQRSGRLTEWHQDLLGQVANFCRARQEYCFKTETIPQVAILHSETTYYLHNEPLFNFGRGNQAVEGALHAVLENGYSADLLNEEMLLERMGQYPVVLVPEREILPVQVMAALRSYVEQGGRLLMSGAHVAAQFPELTGTLPVEGAQHGGVYLPADEGAVTVGGAWQVVSLHGAEAVAGMLNQQDPNVNQLDAPSATRYRLGNGVVVAVHGPVFESYHGAHYPRLRRYIGDLIADLDSPGLMHRQGPWFIEIAARQKDDRQLIQLINRATDGYTAPNRHMVEHVPDAGPFTLSIPLAERPSRCYMAPETDGLEWTWKDGVLTAQIGGLGIHNVLVIE